jgi:hypothetical protein
LFDLVHRGIGGRDIEKVTAFCISEIPTGQIADISKLQIN